MVARITVPVVMQVCVMCCAVLRIRAEKRLTPPPTAVGTNQTLTEVSGINSSYAWNSSTGNVTSSPHGVWTQRGWGSDVCHVWVNWLSTGSVSWNMRSGAGYNFYALCGPAQ